MESSIRIARETEFYQGYIRFKMSVTNESPYVVNDVTLDFIFDEKLLHITKHDDVPVKKEKFVMGNIYGGKSSSFTILFEPLTCAKAADIKCQVTYADHEGRMDSIFMEPKEISVVCPIMKTDSDINIGRLKEFIEELPSKDSRVYEIQSGFDVKKLAHLAREVVEKHDVRHISTLHTRDGRTCEIWYYGRTKVTKDDIVIRVSILTEHHTIELFAATRSAEALTGLLAEVGRDLKHVVEDKASGRVVNVHIKDSLVQRSNLLDMCDMDGTCDVNVVIEDSVIQRTGIAAVDEEKARLKKEQEEQERLRKQQEEELERRRREEEQKAQTSTPVTSQPSPASTPQKPTSIPSKSQSLLPAEEKSSKKMLLIPMLIIVVIAGYLMISPILSGNSDNAVTVASTQDRLKTYTNSIGMEFVLIPAGEFMMGSPSNEEDRASDEGPVHRVTISNDFYMGKYEVTQKQWREVMGDNHSYFKGDDRPVEFVLWDDVQEFIRKLNEKEGTDKYRLPSEAEWEYACRAGTTTRYSFGDDESRLGEYAWFGEDLDAGSTHSVGQKNPNPWGLYDMHGNVWEWVQDEWHYDYKGAPSDGSAWEDGSGSTWDAWGDGSGFSRVFRGGGWLYDAMYCRSAYRSCSDPGNRYNYLLGFRLLQET